MGFLPSFNFEEIKTIIFRGWQDLVGTDFYQLKFSEVELATKVAIILFALILFKMIRVIIGRWLGWEKYSRKDSGHFISGENQGHFFARLLLAIPTLILIVPLLAVVLAIAYPYFAVTKEEKKYITTRTRIDLRDVSGSMSYQFQNTKISAAEIAFNAHLKFLKMREGKNDRTAFWLFSNNPFPIQEDFIVDDELYYLKVYDAPWELSSSSYDGTEAIWQTYLVPYSRYLQVAGQGGTQLTETLKAVIQVFDKDAKKQKASFRSGSRSGRAVLIITDAAISDFETTKSEFNELAKRNITPYIIFINSKQESKLPSSESSGISPLLNEIVARGGKFFPVSDERALDRAYQEIDRLEKVQVEIEKKEFKVPAFQKFIFLAILALGIIIPLGLISKLLYYP